MSEIQRKELFFLRWLDFKGLEVYFLLLACNLAKRLELMERDFLGLSSKNGNLTVKEEAKEEAKNSGLLLLVLRMKFTVLEFGILSLYFVFLSPHFPDPDKNKKKYHLAK